MPSVEDIKERLELDDDFYFVVWLAAENGGERFGGSGHYFFRANSVAGFLPK